MTAMHKGEYFSFNVCWDPYLRRNWEKRVRSGVPTHVVNTISLLGNLERNYNLTISFPDQLALSATQYCILEVTLGGRKQSHERYTISTRLLKISKFSWGWMAMDSSHVFWDDHARYPVDRTETSHLEQFGKERQMVFRWEYLSANDVYKVLHELEHCTKYVYEWLQ